MIPSLFDYKRASSAAEAISLVTEYGEDAKFLAGGHSLLPLMKLRLAAPSVLVDIGRLKDLSYITDAGSYIAIGALTRHMDVETSSIVKQHVPLLACAAGHVGDPQVRHRGTIGGSIAHADSASDLPATTLALGATYVVQGASGTREIAATDFYKGFLESALRPDEMLTEIRVPKMNGAGWRCARQHGLYTCSRNRCSHSIGIWCIGCRCRRTCCCSSRPTKRPQRKC